MAINSKEHKRHLFCEPFLSLNRMIEQLYLSLNRTVFLRIDLRASKAGQLRAPFRRGLVIQRLFNRVHSHLMDTFEESIIILLFLNETFKKSISTDTFILVLHTGRHAISHKPDYNSEKQKTKTNTSNKNNNNNGCIT